MWHDIRVGCYMTFVCYQLFTWAAAGLLCATSCCALRHVGCYLNRLVLHSELRCPAIVPCCRGGAAWRREFWPPVCAEQVAALASGLVRRGGWLHAPEHRLRYMQVGRWPCCILAGLLGGCWTREGLPLALEQVLSCCFLT